MINITRKEEKKNKWSNGIEKKKWKRMKKQQRIN